MPNPYQYYLNVLSNWSTSVALADLWLVVFDFKSVPALQANVTEAVNRFEEINGANWQISQSNINELLKTEYQNSTEQLMGCVFARKATVPGEALQIKNHSLDYAGYLGPATSLARASFEPLSLTFLETNSSFCDLVIRPWIVLASYYGLVSRASNSKKNIKCSFMDIYQLAKHPRGAVAPLIKRKIIRYFNVVPKSLSSSSVGGEAKYTTRDVSFVYDNYAIIDGGSYT